MSQEYQKVKVTGLSLDRPLPVNIFLPKDELLGKIRTLAQKKVEESLLQAILLGILGGFYQCTSVHFTVRVIATLNTSHVNSDAEQIKVSKLGPGVQMGLYGGFYPIGILMVYIYHIYYLKKILINGGDIFLLHLFYFLIGFYKKCIDIKKASLKLLIVFMTNWIAAVFYTWFFMYLTELFDAKVHRAQVEQLTSKYLDFNFLQTILLGIGCGMVLSFSFMINLAGKSGICRIMSLIFVIGIYPVLFFQHFQDNLSLFPIALWTDASCSTGDFVGKNLIPVFMGNVVGVVMIAFGFAVSENHEEKIQSNLTPIIENHLSQGQ